ncbi:hypothetical protein A4D02_21725 [Niastella koreensis]|uniref:Uncharacterized protein n=2 Tax=Niastella koreensis TaxID=354356 RepID=G8THT8_NIAKG|nr:hypothetical protein [Niastella koreensis]AEV98533.1 hypothetical protein Niako_2178 [Niastella koreensis GR20-10]OQP53024.1 hypothetical protein A4D02_21725 [Niastella koreensis]
MRALTFCIRKTLVLIVLCIFSGVGMIVAQEKQPVDSTYRGHKHVDTLPFVIDSAEVALRIKNLNPSFNLHVDSSLFYKLEINKDQSKYYWFLRNPPVGLRINKDNGLLTFKAEKSYFLSGKLKYDYQYRVSVGVQNLETPGDHLDTAFYITFYNTDIIQSKVKPTIGSTLTIDEGDTVAFKIQCENGNFPIETITFFSSMPVRGATLVRKCDDDFIWAPGFDFVKESDPGKQRTVVLSFVGSNKFGIRDTAQVKIIVNDALNYPLSVEDYKLTVNVINSYVLRLKYTFLQLDKGVKKNKGTRTTFDITGSTTALTGSILASSQPNSQIGKVMPSVGVSLVPVKEAVAPIKNTEQNQASQIRSTVKRLEYMVSDNATVGERDPDIAKKTAKLKEELKQAQVQLVDIPIEITSGMSEKELNDYFNSKKVMKKYRLKK